MNGVPTNYTLDLNAGLTQVLSDGTTTYTYGLGRISQQSGVTPEYFLGDALGSVRQMTDQAGAITYSRSYDPYGVVTTIGGASQSAYGFTGEQQDASGMVYLRARYYNPDVARFLTRDLSGLDSNIYRYAVANPINLSDPTGLASAPISGLSGPAAFAACFDMHTGTQGNAFTYTAGIAVWICKMAYSPDAWSMYKGSFGLGGKFLPTTAHELMGWFIFEHLYRDLLFNGTEPLTQELAVSSIAQIVRNKYYREGETSTSVYYPFHADDYLMTLFGDSRNSVGEASLPITAFIGSFWYQVKTLPNGRIGFRIDNDTTLESGTHIRDRFPGQYRGSVEELIQQEPSVANQPIRQVIRNNPVLSILSSKTRQQTIGSEGGGNMYETFVWSERYDECAGWMMYLFNDPSKWDVQSWPDFRAYTEDPLLPGR